MEELADHEIGRMSGTVMSEFQGGPSFRNLDTGYSQCEEVTVIGHHWTAKSSGHGSGRQVRLEGTYGIGYVQFPENLKQDEGTPANRTASRPPLRNFHWGCCRDTHGWSFQLAAPPTLSFAPPTLCFATPTFGRFGGCLALKRWFLTLAVQNCHIHGHSAFSFLFLDLSVAEHPVNEPFLPTNFLWKLHPWEYPTPRFCISETAWPIVFKLVWGLEVIN